MGRAVKWSEQAAGRWLLRLERIGRAIGSCLDLTRLHTHTRVGLSVHSACLQRSAQRRANALRSRDASCLGTAYGSLRLARPREAGASQWECITAGAPGTVTATRERVAGQASSSPHNQRPATAGRAPRARFCMPQPQPPRPATAGNGPWEPSAHRWEGGWRSPRTRAPGAGARARAARASGAWHHLRSLRRRRV